MWSFSHNVHYERETSLSFSLPVNVGQSDLLLHLWNWPGPLESFVYRKTRYGAFSWRLGTSAIFDSTSRSAAPTTTTTTTNDDRLSIVRKIINGAGATAEVVSQLKAVLVTDRTIRYEDSLSFRTNARYPLVLDDRLSVELWPLPLDLERRLIDCEFDTSDNNLGLAFEHRLSLRAGICKQCRRAAVYASDCSICRVATGRDYAVRLSLRSSLNEYHEIAYHLELECEEDERCDGDSTARRRTRHDAIAAVFRDVAVPMLSVHWPDGLSRESVPYTLEPTLLANYHRGTVAAVRMTSGRSYFTTDRLFSAIQREATLGAAGDKAMAARLKFDGRQTYGWYAMGEFWANSERVENICSNARELLSGMYIYQLETLPSNHHVIVEASFAVSHRQVVAMNGGGALCRQIEVTENSCSAEQRTPATAYVLLDGSTDDFWNELRDFLQAPTRRAASNFFHVCSDFPISYVASLLVIGDASTTTTSPMPFAAPSPALGTSERLVLGKLTRDLFYCDRCPPSSSSSLNDDDKIWRSWLSIVGGMGKIHATAAATTLEVAGGDDVATAATATLNRALIPLTLEYSLHFLRRMREELVANVSSSSAAASSLSVTRTYALPGELTDLWTDFNAAAIPFDGVLSIRRRRREQQRGGCCYYEKMKLRQTIEVFVKRNPLTLCSADHGAFATFRHATADKSHWRLSPSLMYHRRRRRQDPIVRCCLVILGLPIPVIDNGRIAELEYAEVTATTAMDDDDDDEYWRNGGNKYLRFVRWRPDKEMCDKRAKIIGILRNRRGTRVARHDL